MFESEVKTVLGSSQLKSTFPESNDSTAFYAPTGWLQNASAFRYGGPREAYKFKLIQKNLQSLAIYFIPISDSLVENMESIVENLTPDDSVIAELQHLRAQVEFQEYLKLKTTKHKWL